MLLICRLLPPPPLCPVQVRLICHPQLHSRPTVTTAYDDNGERARDRSDRNDRDRSDYRDDQQTANDAAPSSASARDRPAPAPVSSSSGRGGYRQSARKLYVGQLPPSATQQDVMDLFARSPVPCALPSQVDMKPGYAFVVRNERSRRRGRRCDPLTLYRSMSR